MLPESLDQELDAVPEDDRSTQDDINLAELAQKIVDKLLRELSIETERIGR